jgi:hypothetical protein
VHDQSDCNRTQLFTNVVEQLRARLADSAPEKSAIDSIPVVLPERSCFDAELEGASRGDIESDAAHSKDAVVASGSAMSIDVEPSNAGLDRVGPPRPPPPPSCRARLGCAHSDAKADLPSWPGPRPSEDWKAHCVVNWQPLRKQSRWEGSIWQQVYQNVQERGVVDLPHGDYEKAFMKRSGTAASDARAKSITRTQTSKHDQLPCRARALPSKAAFTADLCYNRLTRMGVGDLDALRWILPPRGAKTDATEEQTPPQLETEALEALFELLHAADGHDAALEATQPLAETLSDGASQAASEAFLRQLATVGPLAASRENVTFALDMEYFPAELERLEQQCNLALVAVESVISSTTLPLLLEGMLLLGNYVNASSRTLGAAVGLTLESLARLAHTKCVALQEVASGSHTSSPANALSLLIEQLSAKHGASFAASLAADLETCRSARDVDPKAIRQAVEKLISQTMVAQSRREVNNFAPAFAPSRLDAFLAEAMPRLGLLSGLVGNLDSAAAGLRKHFAEPPGSTLPEMLETLSTLVVPLRHANSTEAPVRGPTREGITRTPRTPRSDAATRRPQFQRPSSNSDPRPEEKLSDRRGELDQIVQGPDPSPVTDATLSVADITDQVASKREAFEKQLASLPRDQRCQVGNDRGTSGCVLHDHGPKRRLVQVLA